MRRKSIIVDEQLARKFWPGQDPLGHRMYFPLSVEKLMEMPPADQMMTVVGVVENVRLDGLVDGPGFRTVGAYYMPLEQTPVRSLGLTVRTAQTPTAATGAIRQAIAEVDAELPFYSVRTMEEQLGKSLVDRRTPMILATGFAAVALFLAAIGIYGVLAYQVSQRTREIGIRMALGAATSSIFSMVLREGAAIVTAGAAIGLVGAFLLRQSLQSQLYEMQAMDRSSSRRSASSSSWWPWSPACSGAQGCSHRPGDRVDGPVGAGRAEGGRAGLPWLAMGYLYSLHQPYPPEDSRCRAPPFQPPSRSVGPFLPPPDRPASSCASLLYPPSSGPRSATSQSGGHFTRSP